MKLSVHLIFVKICNTICSFIFVILIYLTLVIEYFFLDFLYLSFKFIFLKFFRVLSPILNLCFISNVPLFILNVGYLYLNIFSLCFLSLFNIISVFRELTYAFIDFHYCTLIFCYISFSLFFFYHFLSTFFGYLLLIFI